MSQVLKFGKGNAKLDKKIATFSLPAGWTCPGAKECKSKTHNVNGSLKIRDGKDTKFRCFSASTEVLYRNTWVSRQHNLKLLKRHSRSPNRMAALIHNSIPKNTTHIRLHVSGDFFSQTYFDAWIKVAERNPHIVMYAYTKSIPFWLNRHARIPQNLILTASFGSKYDELIEKHGLKCARVVFSEAEAAALGLPIDHDDSHAMAPTGNFALLLHGVQPLGSEAAKAKAALGSKGSYSRNKK